MNNRPRQGVAEEGTEHYEPADVPSEARKGYQPNVYRVDCLASNIGAHLDISGLAVSRMIKRAEHSNATSNDFARRFATCNSE